MVNASRPLHRKHHLSVLDLVAHGSESDSRSEGCVQITSGSGDLYWRETSNMNGLFLSGDTKSEENGNVNAKVKTNLLRAGIEPAT